MSNDVSVSGAENRNTRVWGQKCVGARNHGFLGPGGFDQRRRKPTPALEKQSPTRATATATASRVHLVTAIAPPPQYHWHTWHNKICLIRHIGLSSLRSFCCFLLEPNPTTFPIPFLLSLSLSLSLFLLLCFSYFLSGPFSLSLSEDTKEEIKVLGFVHLVLYFCFVFVVVGWKIDLRVSDGG